MITCGLTQTNSISEDCTGKWCAVRYRTYCITKVMVMVGGTVMSTLLCSGNAVMCCFFRQESGTEIWA